MQFVEVAVDSPVGGSRTFSYSVPEGMKLVAGQSVFVPFGSQSLQGIVFELCDTPQVAGAACGRIDSRRCFTE